MQYARSLFPPSNPARPDVWAGLGGVGGRRGGIAHEASELVW